MRKLIPVLLLGALLAGGCGQVPSATEALSPLTVSTSEPAPLTAAPVIAATPSPTPSPTPIIAQLVFAMPGGAQDTQICAALRAWVPATQTITLNDGATTNYNFSAVGVNDDNSDGTLIGPVGAAVLKFPYNTGAICKVTITNGQLVSIQ